MSVKGKSTKPIVSASSQAPPGILSTADTLKKPTARPKIARHRGEKGQWLRNFRYLGYVSIASVWRDIINTDFADIMSSVDIECVENELKATPLSKLPSINDKKNPTHKASEWITTEEVITLIKTLHGEGAVSSLKNLTTGVDLLPVLLSPPKIKKNAQQFLYNIMEIIQMRALADQNEVCRDQNMLIIHPSHCATQLMKKHGIKRGHYALKAMSQQSLDHQQQQQQHCTDNKSKNKPRKRSQVPKTPRKTIKTKARTPSKAITQASTQASQLKA